MRSADGVSIGRKPKRSKLRRMSSMSALNCSCSLGRNSWAKPFSKAGRTFFMAVGSGRLGAVFFADVILDDRLELLRDVLALERHGLAAVDVHRRHRYLVGSRETDADVGVLGFTRPVDHAAHDRDAHLFHPGVCGAPDRHLIS